MKIGIKRENPDDPDQDEYEPPQKFPSNQSKEDRVLAPKANSEPILSSRRSNLPNGLPNGLINGIDYNVLLLKHGIDSLNRRNALAIPPSPIEVMMKIFPSLRRYILELILKGCDNDIVQAIECILATSNQSSSQHRKEPTIPRDQEVLPVHYQVTRQQVIPPMDTMTTVSTLPNMDILSRSRGLARAQIYGPSSRFPSMVTKSTFSTPLHIPTLQFDRVRQNCTSPGSKQCVKCSCGPRHGEVVGCKTTDTGVRHYQPSWI